MMGDSMMHGMPGGMVWMMIGAFFWVILVVGLVLLVVWVIKTPGKNVRSETEETPLDILKKRYARGEITRSEYEEMKRDIS